MHWQDDPVVGPDAFSEPDNPETAQARAAYLLRLTGRMIGVEDDLIPSESFPTPEVEPAAPASLDLESLLVDIDIDLATQEQFDRIPEVSSFFAGSYGYDAMASAPTCTPHQVGTLVEAELHSEHEILRVAAAVAALDTTGPRERIEAELVSGLSSEDDDVQAMAAVGLARMQPSHEALRRLRGPRAGFERYDEEHETLLMTHGTWASNKSWWRAGGDFYDYIAGHRGDLWDPSPGWTGDYDAGQRDTDAQDLHDALQAGGFAKPDFMAHSHGATVANLATHKGQEFAKLFFLSWPVHGAWHPDDGQIDEVIDIRVRMDLVIMADRGGQRIRNANYDVIEERNGWFSHGASHDPDYWDQHGLTAYL